MFGGEHKLSSAHMSPEECVQSAMDEMRSFVPCEQEKYVRKLQEMEIKPGDVVFFCEPIKIISKILPIKNWMSFNIWFSKFIEEENLSFQLKFLDESFSTMEASISFDGGATQTRIFNAN